MQVDVDHLLHPVKHFLRKKLWLLSFGLLLRGFLSAPFYSCELLHLPCRLPLPALDVLFSDLLLGIKTNLLFFSLISV